MFSILFVASLFIVSQCQHAAYHPGYHHPRNVYPVAQADLVRPVRFVAPAHAHAHAHVDEAPKPYSYSYEAPADGGSSSRQETSDEAGRVTGSYSINDEDGRSRLVEYYADETGFHANVRTNEPGTANQNPANVAVESTAPEVAPVYNAPLKPAVVPVTSPVVNRVVATAPIVAPYNIAPINRGLYYNPLAHRHGLYDNHGLYNNRGLYAPYDPHHSHGAYGGLYGNYGLYGNPGHYRGGYYPGSRYYY